MKPERKLLPCPFCGSEAIVRSPAREGETFEIVGCSNITTMLCPRPSLIVYENKDGVFDYKYWNRREPGK